MVRYMINGRWLQLMDIIWVSCSADDIFVIITNLVKPHLGQGRLAELDKQPIEASCNCTPHSGPGWTIRAAVRGVWFMTADNRNIVYSH